MGNEELVRKYQQGDKNALNDLIENNKGLVMMVANKFYTLGSNAIDKDDLIQEGFIGLMRAVEKYDLDNPNKAAFSTYSTFWIYQKINRFIKNRCTENETSLNATLDDMGDKGAEKQDFLLSEEIGYSNAEFDMMIKSLHQDLEEVMSKCLTLKEREVIKLHYGWDGAVFSFSDISFLIGGTASATRGKELNALRKIRKDYKSYLFNLYGNLYFSGLRYTYNKVNNFIDLSIMTGNY